MAAGYLSSHGHTEARDLYFRNSSVLNISKLLLKILYSIKHYGINLDYYHLLYNSDMR